MTDVQVLICTSIGPKVEEQGEFLLRFVYHETLISTLKSLKIDPPKATDFNVMMAAFKKHQAYGALAAAMNLVKLTKKPANPGGTSGKRVFNSSILGGVIGSGDPKVYEASAPLYRAQALMEKILQK